MTDPTITFAFVCVTNQPCCCLSSSVNGRNKSICACCGPCQESVDYHYFEELFLKCSSCACVLVPWDMSWCWARGGVVAPQMSPRSSLKSYDGRETEFWESWAAQVFVWRV